MAEAMRADGRRNRESLLEVARAAFDEFGTEVSLREVARRAGVGIGTLYRHFPTREALIEACMSHGLDALCAQGAELLDSDEPGEALSTWLRAFASGSARYLGLPASLLAAAGDPSSQLHHSCQEMRATAARLLHRAQHAGQVRGDIEVSDLLILAMGIAWAVQQTTQCAEVTSRLLGLADTGIRLPAPA